MDLVYTYTKEEHNGIELRYSIRSMVKHLRGWKRLVIVGDDPGFIKGAIFIPVLNAHLYNPDRNIYEKILSAAKDRRISSDFVASSDDYFLLQDYHGASFPYYRSNDLADYASKFALDHSYRPHVDNTLKALQARGLPTMNFNIHCPILYNKKKFRETVGSFEWNIKKGYLVKSLYANSNHVPGEVVEENKIHTPKTASAIRRRVEGKRFFSTSTHSLNAEMVAKLQELYPNPSKWEL